MAILHSKVFHFTYLVANQGEGRVIPQVKASKLYDLPFPKPSNDARSKRLGRLAQTLIELDKELQQGRRDEQRTAIERRVAGADRQIDELVYELYGLSDKEIKVVEEVAR